MEKHDDFFTFLTYPIERKVMDILIHSFSCTNNNFNFQKKGSQ